jgi:hypothetical protein
VLHLILSAVLAASVMPVDKIERGQQGECLTVFEGDQIESFTFVVKGVMADFSGPHRDIIIVRLQGEKPEFTGVVAGMSGSPCSIDGKLIGALSYSFAMFAKEPIAGITPYAGMQQLMRSPKEQLPWRISADWDAFAKGQPSVLARNTSVNGFVPIATPLSFAGVPASVQQYFTPYFQSLGFETIAGGWSGKSKILQDKSLQPGSSIAGVLVDGDVRVAATGTVTSVEGNEVLAFGHPFTGAGAVSFPMAKADIINTMASAQRSFKMALSGPIVGELTQDRLTGIGGILGPGPRMLPVDGSLQIGKNKKDTFHFQVARDVGLSPRFVAMGIAGALNGRVDTGDRGVVRFTGTIKADGLQPIVVRNVFAGERDSNLLTNAAIDVARNFSLIWDTPFAPPPNTSIQIEAQFDPSPVRDSIEDLHFATSAAKAGEALAVTVRLQRLGGATQLQHFSVPIPLSWNNEILEFVATGAEGRERLETEMAGVPKPDNLEQVARWVAGRYSNGRLYLIAVRQRSGVRAGVEMLSSVPPSVMLVLAGDTHIEERRQSIGSEESRECAGAVVGLARRSIRVMSP